MRIIVYIFFLLTFSGCGVYAPTTCSIPLMSAEKEFQIDGGMTTFGSFTGTATFAPKDHFATQLFFQFPNKIIWKDFLANSDVQYYQGAIGYFNKFKDGAIYELYGGFGYGLGGSAHGDGNYSSSHYGVGYMQVNIGNSTKYIDYGVGFKLGVLNSTSYNSRNYQVTLSAFYANVLFEPNFFIRTGFEKVKFSIKLGLCMIGPIDNPDFYYTPLNLSMGINYTFKPIFKQRKSEVVFNY